MQVSTSTNARFLDSPLGVSGCQFLVYDPAPATSIIFTLSIQISRRWTFAASGRRVYPLGGVGAILLTTTFVAVAMQGMVVAMLLKSKALQMAEANRWVQADLEQIRSRITLSQLPVGTNQLRCHPASVDAGFADLVRDNLAGSNVTGATDYHLATLIETSQTGKTFQIARTVSISSTPENTEAKIR